jgi:hypothetical protein
MWFTKVENLMSRQSSVEQQFGRNNLCILEKNNQFQAAGHGRLPCP